MLLYFSIDLVKISQVWLRTKSNLIWHVNKNGGSICSIYFQCPITPESICSVNHKAISYHICSVSFQFDHVTFSKKTLFVYSIQVTSGARSPERSLVAVGTSNLVMLTSCLRKSDSSCRCCLSLQLHPAVLRQSGQIQ